MKNLLLGLLITFSLTSLAQEEHLVPIDNIFMPGPIAYEMALKNFLFIDVTDSTLAKMVVSPSFSNEYSVSIRKTLKNEYYINTIEILNRFKRETPKIKTNEIKINEEFATKMNALFLKMISQTRFTNKRNVGCDGKDYYFVASDCGNCNYGALTGEGYGVIMGKIWSPQSERFVELIALSDKLFNLKTKTDYLEEEKKLIEKCDWLIKQF